MSRRLVTLAAVCAATALSAVSIAAAQTLGRGVYTTVQADRGAVLFAGNCAACHGADLGGGESAPPLTGAQFQDNWSGQTLKGLFDRVLSMPPGASANLTRDQKVDVLAHILRVNGYPAGPHDLSGRSSELEGVVIGAPPAAAGGVP